MDYFNRLTNKSIFENTLGTLEKVQEQAVAKPVQVVAKPVQAPTQAPTQAQATAKPTQASAPSVGMKGGVKPTKKFIEKYKKQVRRTHRMQQDREIDAFLNQFQGMDLRASRVRSSPSPRSSMNSLFRLMTIKESPSRDSAKKRPSTKIPLKSKKTVIAKESSFDKLLSDFSKIGIKQTQRRRPKARFTKRKTAKPTAKKNFLLSSQSSVPKPKTERKQTRKVEKMQLEPTRASSRVRTQVVRYTPEAQTAKRARR